MPYLPIPVATAEQSRSLQRPDNRCIASDLTMHEASETAATKLIAPPLMDTCSRGILALEQIVEDGNDLPDAEDFFEEFPFIADEVYREAANDTLATAEYVAGISRALIERVSTPNSPRPKIQKLRRDSKYSEKKKQAYLDYVEEVFKDEIISPGVLESTRTIGATLEVVPHILAQKGLENMMAGLRDALMFRSCRSGYVLLNQWVRATRENDLRLVNAVQRTGVVDQKHAGTDKYYGLRFNPKHFDLSGYRLRFADDIDIESAERKSFGCPTNHQGHTGRLYMAVLRGASKSGALDYVLDNSDEILNRDNEPLKVELAA